MTSRTASSVILPERVRGMVLEMPVLDNALVAGTGWAGAAAAKLYAGGRDLTNPLISPIFGDFSGFPPAILSRLQRYDVRRLTVSEIEGKLTKILAGETQSPTEDAATTRGVSQAATMA